MTHEFGGRVLLLGAGCGCGAGCMVRAGPGFRCVFLCLEITKKIKILNSIKNKAYPKLVYKVSVMCSWHRCSDK